MWYVHTVQCPTYSLFGDNSFSYLRYFPLSVIDHFEVNSHQLVLMEELKDNICNIKKDSNYESSWGVSCEHNLIQLITKGLLKFLDLSELKFKLANKRDFGAW